MASEEIRNPESSHSLGFNSLSLSSLQRRTALNLFKVPIRVSSRASVYLRQMGLQSQLNDLSSVSIPLLLVATLATCLNYLRSSFSDLIHSVRPSRFHPHHHLDDGLFDAVGSGLAGLILFAEQMNLNRDLSHRFGDQIDDALGGVSDCVVCLSNLKVGDRVRRLSCRHVFHKECFDGWLDHLNFNCPLCRSPLVSDERASLTRRHVGEDVVSWLSMR